jgi:ankyrin repeat protein
LAAQNFVGDTVLNATLRVKNVTDMVSIVRLLFEANPESAQLRNQYGDLPLHIASSYQAQEVIEFLIQECPTSILVQNFDGNVPLHLACWQNQLFNNVQLLVESCPVALKCKNKRKETPLHIACSFKASFNIL